MCFTNNIKNDYYLFYLLFINNLMNSAKHETDTYSLTLTLDIVNSVSTLNYHNKITNEDWISTTKYTKDHYQDIKWCIDNKTINVNKHDKIIYFHVFCDKLLFYEIQFKPSITTEDSITAEDRIAVLENKINKMQLMITELQKLNEWKTVCIGYNETGNIMISIPTYKYFKLQICQYRSPRDISDFLDSIHYKSTDINGIITVKIGNRPSDTYNSELKHCNIYELRCGGRSIEALDNNIPTNIFKLVIEQGYGQLSNQIWFDCLLKQDLPNLTVLTIVASDFIFNVNSLIKFKRLKFLNVLRNNRVNPTTETSKQITIKYLN